MGTCNSGSTLRKRKRPPSSLKTSFGLDSRDHSLVSQTTRSLCFWTEGISMRAAEAPSSSEEYESAEEDEQLEEEEVENEVARMASSNKASVRPKIYNADALHDKLEDISWPQGREWLEAQALTLDAPPIDDIEDDLARELSFYTQALEAAKEGIRRFDAAGVGWKRPPDYYAEMVKSDEHMARIKQQLMFEERQILEAQERRKQRESKKFQKEVMAERKKEKVQAKKHMIAQVSQLRKQRSKGGFQGDLDVDSELKRMERPPAHLGERIRPGERKLSKKREYRNAKFGFGGKRRKDKQNDAVSSANMDDYKQGTFSFGCASPLRFVPLIMYAYCLEMIGST
eukprot:jgi/Botrbrau1/10267/Bobra.0140s0020.2